MEDDHREVEQTTPKDDLSDHLLLPRCHWRRCSLS